jgi:tetratricopeptide (TPR) repeat protein
MQDRYMYLAMLGPLVLVASALDAACRSQAARTAAVGAAMAAIAACTVQTYRQVEVWDSPLSMWKEGALKRAAIPGEPPHPVEDYDAKVAYLRAALQGGPTAVIHNNLGALYFQAGELAPALRELEAATKLDASHGTIALNLGRAYARAGRLDAARERLEHAARVEPYLSLARIALARVHLARGDAAAARRELDAHDRLRPESPWMTSRERAHLQRLEAAGTGGDAR